MLYLLMSECCGMRHVRCNSNGNCVSVMAGVSVVTGELSGEISLARAARAAVMYGESLRRVTNHSH